MTVVQLATGSPNLTYETAGAFAYVVSGALFIKDQIKEVNFGTITSNAGGVALGSSPGPINGEILKVEWKDVDTATTGSIFIEVDGVEIGTGAREVIGSIINTSNPVLAYPSVAMQDHTRTTGVVCNNYLVASGGGLGNAKSGTLKLWYR